MNREEKLSLFGEGPWVDEPDRKEWRAHGLPCLMLRAPLFGHWCGYAGVPPEHPLHGRAWRSVRLRLHAHRGLNFAGPCDDRVCHEPRPGEPEAIWWLGFDCMHADDFVPVMSSPWARALGGYHGFDERDRSLYGTYRDAAYVEAEVQLLAIQLAEMVR